MMPMTGVSSSAGLSLRKAPAFWPSVFAALKLANQSTIFSEYSSGARDSASTPPASTRFERPTRMLVIAESSACMPDAQLRITVQPGTLWPQPMRSATTRPMLTSSGDGLAQPRITSSSASGANGMRISSARPACTARSDAANGPGRLRALRNGVRAPSTTKMGWLIAASSVSWIALCGCLRSGSDGVRCCRSPTRPDPAGNRRRVSRAPTRRLARASIVTSSGVITPAACAAAIGSSPAAPKDAPLFERIADLRLDRLGGERRRQRELDCADGIVFAGCDIHSRGQPVARRGRLDQQPRHFVARARRTARHRDARAEIPASAAALRSSGWGSSRSRLRWRSAP